MPIRLPSVSLLSQLRRAELTDFERGQLMAQWNPKATAYKYPQSMVNTAVHACAHCVLIGLSRRADFTVIKTERSASRSPTDPIATMAPAV